MSSARPFVKWPGGKQALAETLVRFFPQTITTYYEPFLGGGSVFFALRPSRCVLSDLNEWLIDTYTAVRDDWRRVAALLDGMPNNRAAYLHFRGLPVKNMDIWHRAAHLIYLNKTCFRGLFRVNSKGDFNVPYGDYNRRYYSPENLEVVSTCLKNAQLLACDYRDALVQVREEDFVYLDPPYHRLGGYSDFNRYTPGKFREEDHEELAGFCRDLTQRGIRWAQSNSNTAFIRRLYESYNIYEVASRREINLNSKERSIKELLITNYERPSNICIPHAQELLL